jgi:hypothetical protein
MKCVRGVRAAGVCVIVCKSKEVVRNIGMDRIGLWLRLEVVCRIQVWSAELGKTSTRCVERSVSCMKRVVVRPVTARNMCLGGLTLPHAVD